MLNHTLVKEKSQTLWGDRAQTGLPEAIASLESQLTVEE
jgi:hypothetical protein